MIRLMIALPTLTHATSDLRNSSVIDESFVRPVSIRGKGGGLMVMIPKEIIDRNNEVSRFAQMLGIAIIESQRSDASPAVLGDIGYIASWDEDRRAQFLRGFAEALVAGIADNDPEVVSTYIEVMSHAADPLLPQFDSSRGTQADRDRVDEHMAARSRR